jgi:hypothetical protein
VCSIILAGRTTCAKTIFLKKNLNSCLDFFLKYFKKVSEHYQVESHFIGRVEDSSLVSIAKGEPEDADISFF